MKYFMEVFTWIKSWGAGMHLLIWGVFGIFAILTSGFGYVSIDEDVKFICIAIFGMMIAAGAYFLFMKAVIMGKGKE